MSRELQHLFLIDVKRRLINNTPSDIYRLASRLPPGSVEIVDLRFNDPARGLPPARTVVLFLETEGTWMCFDWDKPRFTQRIAGLVRQYGRCIVVGPQARALRALTGMDFEAADTLDFAAAIAPDLPAQDIQLAPEYLEPGRNRAYNGEHFDGTRMRLLPTFSLSYSMNCPLRCSFCFYGDAARTPHAPFDFVLNEIATIWSHGHAHFYFMDPNLLLTRAQAAGLRTFHEQTDRRFTYTCQVSPNHLSEGRLAELASSGCRAVVVGIENAALIAAKGSLEQAADRVARAIAWGIMPMLFFMIDGQSEVEALLEAFGPVPFRYSVLNHAFAGDRSLAAIEAGFANKAQLAAENRALIQRLQQRPNYLGALAVAGIGA